MSLAWCYFQTWPDGWDNYSFESHVASYPRKIFPTKEIYSYSFTIAANKQLLDELFVISRIIKVEVSVKNTNRDLDYSGYHKNRI